MFHDYQEAAECLERAVSEGGKTSNVDITAMLHDIQTGLVLVTDIQLTETDPLLLAGLNQLIPTLSHYKNTLLKKIVKLDEQSRIETQSDSSQEISENQSAKPVCHTGAQSIRGESSGDRERRITIEQTLVKKGEISFSEVAGLDEAKETLKEAVIFPIKYPHLFTGGRKPWRRILLYGPPGTGKTHLARAVSSEIESAFYSVSSADLLSSWFGESEKLIKELFSHTTRGSSSRPAVIFIDEIDSICRQRSSREEESTRRIKTELLKQMEGVDGSTENVFLLCATNCPWELDSAFIRRFQKRIFVPLPDREARIKLIKIHDQNSELNLAEKEWIHLGHITNGYSGSDLSTIMMQAFFIPVRELQTTRYWRPTTDGFFEPVLQPLEGSLQANLTDLPSNKVRSRRIHKSDVVMAMQQCGRTVTVDEIKRFKDFTEKFGING